ncbi:MAG: hypothetical protein AB7D57_05350, partial [Desulfovibrionaceae bacterium]
MSHPVPVSRPRGVPAPAARPLLPQPLLVVTLLILLSLAVTLLASAPAARAQEPLQKVPDLPVAPLRPAPDQDAPPEGMEPAPVTGAFGWTLGEPLDGVASTDLAAAAAAGQPLWISRRPPHPLPFFDAYSAELDPDSGAVVQIMAMRQHMDAERARSDYEELTRALQAKYGPGTGPEPGCRAYGAGDRIVTCCL